MVGHLLYIFVNYTYQFFLREQSAILALDDTVLDADQVENLIKFTPTKDEIELLKVIVVFGFSSLQDSLSYQLSLCILVTTTGLQRR